MDAFNKLADDIAGRAIMGAEALFSELRLRIAKSADISSFADGDISDFLAVARRMLERAEPLLIEHLTDTDMAAWIGGYDYLAKNFPPWLVQEFSTGIRSTRKPPPPPNFFRLKEMFAPYPKLRFPKLEYAASVLFDRDIMTREQWDAASDAARERAFFITGDILPSAIEKVRDELVADIDEGTSLRTFRNRVQDILERSSIGPARLETIYRTNVQAAFRDGRETLATDPVVTELFPYQEYVPIRDARTRDTHWELGVLGLDGTGVYRRDDPFWDRFTPPWDYNCRCGVRLLTIEQAARMGVKEAQDWLKYGAPPERPNWRLNYIPFPRNEGWGSRGRVAVGA